MGGGLVGGGWDLKRKADDGRTPSCVQSMSAFGNVVLPSPAPSTKRPSIEGVSTAIFVRASSVGMLGLYCRLHEPIASGVSDLNSLC